MQPALQYHQVGLSAESWLLQRMPVRSIHRYKSIFGGFNALIETKKTFLKHFTKGFVKCFMIIYANGQIPK